MAFDLRALALLALVLSSSTFGREPRTGGDPKASTRPSRENLGPEVIYGNDDRKDYYQLTPDMKILADSTVGLFDKDNLTPNATTGMTAVYTRTLGAYKNLCPGEKFYDQPVAAFCSGALIGPNRILTAGHCIENQSECEDTKIAFGYKTQTAGVYPSELPTANVYQCKRILTRHDNFYGADYGIIELDRDVTGFVPLTMDHESPVYTSQRLIISGHPIGLPVKVATGFVKGTEAEYFYGNIDSMAGNSGSSIFDQNSRRIVGILVRGYPDFQDDTSADCKRWTRWSENDPDSAELTRVSVVPRFAPPRKVRSLAVKSVNDIAVVVAWSTGFGGSTKYRVLVQSPEAPPTCNGGTTQTAREIRVLGLKPLTDYKISVCALNALDEISEVSTVAFKTQTALPPGPPAGFKLASRTEDSLTVRWGKVKYRTSSYVLAAVDYLSPEAATLSCAHSSAVDVGNVASASVPGLTRGMPYKLALCAKGPTGLLSRPVFFNAWTLPLPAPRAGNFRLVGRKQTAIRMAWTRSKRAETYILTYAVVGSDAEKALSCRTSMPLISTGPVSSVWIDNVPTWTRIRVMICSKTAEGVLSLPSFRTVKTIGPRAIPVQLQKPEPGVDLPGPSPEGFEDSE